MSEEKTKTKTTLSEFPKASSIEMKLKRSIKQFFHRLQVGSEDPSVLCSASCEGMLPKAKIKSFLSGRILN